MTKVKNKWKKYFFIFSNCNTGEEPSFNQCDPHTVCGLLKLFLRELEEPLFPFHLYSTVRDLRKLVGNRQKDPRYLVALRELVQTQLPADNRNTLTILFDLFGQIVAQERVNKMSASNLAIVMAPNLLRASSGGLLIAIEDSQLTCELIAIVIENNKLVFGGEEIGTPQLLSATPAVQSQQNGSLEKNHYMNTHHYNEEFGMDSNYEEVKRNNPYHNSHAEGEPKAETEYTGVPPLMDGNRQNLQQLEPSPYHNTQLLEFDPITGAMVPSEDVQTRVVTPNAPGYAEDPTSYI